MCKCDLCQARELGCHPWEILWGINSLESQLFRADPSKPIYWYEDIARSQRNNQPKVLKLAA